MSWNWSTDWTTQAGVDFTDPTNGPFPMFWRAMRERYRVALASEPPALPASGTDAVQSMVTGWGGPGNTPNWGSLQKLIDYLATFFARPGTGTGGTWENTTGILNLKYNDAFNSVQDRNFPYPNGWSRYFPRTIYTVSQPGTNGWRARFEALAGIQPYYGVLSTDPLFSTSVSTPVGERKYTGQYFVYQSGAWAVDNSSQASPPDVVNETGATLAMPGDYITGQMLNDIRDAINSMTTPCVASYKTILTNLGAPVPPFNNVTLSGLAGTAGDYAQSNGYFGSGGGASIAAADAAFTITSTAPMYRTGTTPWAYAYTSNNYGSYYTEANYQQLYLANLYPVPYAFSLDWYTTIGTYYIFGNGLTFDAEGTGMPSGVWHKFASASGAANVDVFSGPMFPFNMTAPPPNWSNMGWTAGPAYALRNFAVASGFTYVSGYAGT